MPGRLRRLINSANATVNQASGEIRRTSNNANEAIDFAEALLADIKDGIRFKVVQTGEHTLWDFMMGKCKELPISVQVDIEEEEDDKPPA